MDKVTIQIDAKWARRVSSPLYHVANALQGISVSFAPLFIYWCGRGRIFRGAEGVVLPLCFGTILLVGFFYMSLGVAVIRELRKHQQRSDTQPAEHRALTLDNGSSVQLWMMSR